MSQTISFTRGTSKEFILDQITNSVVCDLKVKITLKNAQAVYGKFIFDNDADELLKKDMVRFVSNARIEDYDNTGKIELSRIMEISRFTQLIIY